MTAGEATMASGHRSEPDKHIGPIAILREGRARWVSHAMMWWSGPVHRGQGSGENR